MVALIEPHYPISDKYRLAIGLEQMLRIYFLQQWFNLFDPAVEDAPTGPRTGTGRNTVCKFRHLLERHELGERILARVNTYLAGHGLKVSTGTIVDATILHAPSSTSNRSSERDP